jgi:hypothetical protein
MDDDAITEPVQVTDDVVVWSEDGRFLVTGEQGAVDRFVEHLAPERQLRVGAVGPVSDAMAAMAGASGLATRLASQHGDQAKRYVEVSAKQWELLKRQGMPDAKGTYSPMLRGSGNKITEHVRYKPVGGLNPAMANPTTAVALAALRMAIEELQESVDAIAADVSDLRRIAETAEIGNLAGIYRVLANARAQADATGTIPQATWDSVAPHEVTIQQAADRLRALLRRTVDDLPLDEDSGERYDAARRLLDEGTIERTLRLLVLAEQCRLLWRSLKLDQIRRTEPAALAGEAEAAKAMLAENANADQALIDGLRDAFGRLGKVAALDGVRIMVRAKLPAAAAELRGQVNEFATLRAQQLDSWAPDPTPTFKDAARHLGVMAESVAVEGRKIAGIAAIEGRKYAGQAADEGRKKVGGLLEGWGKRLRDESPAPRHNREP